ncbi:P-loop containing nucleoside triphosphate hydrolase protein [Jimgerdemannia flammicorona]|uniref:P-loop containing nucleoside triphosphate hydrolase protein n=1 Tax=Jimgerdemannia flammicorona TaxID=994334 RepID=A0A433DLQ9_9FUNG|nr:P-loop containing nucleoside triphosphate hydrolase protein [Jimgerdemannia flammicorona]
MANASFEGDITADNGATVIAGIQCEIHDTHNTTINFGQMTITIYLGSIKHLSTTIHVLAGLNHHCQFSTYSKRETTDSKDCSLGRVALIGLGGMGKTQIALEYCFRNYPDKYQYVFWMMADSEESLNSSFLKVAKLLNLSINVNDNLTVRISIIKQWFHNARRRWLMVFDNADDESVYTLMRKSYPNKGDGDIILTTRDAVADHKTAEIRLDEMIIDMESALKLLLRNNNPTSTCTTDPVAQQIIEELGYLPLAIDLAGACMERDDLTPDEFLTNFKTNQKEYLHMEELIKATGNNYAHTVWTVWDLSFTRVKEQNPLAANFLNACAFLHPDNIPLRLFRAHSERILPPTFTNLQPRSLEKALSLLCSSSLVRRTSATTAERSSNDVYREKISIHRLVQNIVRLEINDTEKFQWCMRLISGLSREMPSNSEHDTYEQFRNIMEVYVPHIQRVVLQFRQCGNERRDISNELPSLLSPTVIYLTRQALFESAKDFAELAVASSEIINGPEHSDTATALSNLSYLYTSQQNFEAANPHGRRALAICRKVLGQSHKNTIESLYNLVYIYLKLNMEEHVTWLYLDAAEAGDYVAQRELARRYQYGIGVTMDDDAAFHWLSQTLRSTKASSISW